MSYEQSLAWCSECLKDLDWIVYGIGANICEDCDDETPTPCSGCPGEGSGCCLSTGFEL